MPKSLLHGAIWLAGGLLLSGCSGLGQLPSPDALIKRHIEGAYGDAGLDAQPAVTMSGRLIMEDYDIDAPVVLKVEAPDKRYFKTTIGGIEIIRSCIGGQCWAKEIDSPMQRVEGAQLIFMAETADFYRLRNLKRYYRGVETLRQTDFDGEKAYELHLIRDNGTRDRWYFSRDTGLWLGGVWTLPRTMGAAQVTQYFRNYQPFGDVRLATEIIEVSPTISKVLIDEASFGDIPDSEFKIMP
ncbi:MAG: hypothetical protein WDZ30_07470 [Cellvibrionaceae bacterium]